MCRAQYRQGKIQVQVSGFGFLSIKFKILPSNVSCKIVISLLMNILFALLGFRHQSAQVCSVINSYCNTSNLSPWFCLAGRRTFWTLLCSILSVLKNVTAALACAPLLVSFTDSWLLPDTEGFYSVGETQCSRAHSVSLVPGEWMSLPSGMVRAAPLSAAELNPAPAHGVAASCRRPSAAALSKLFLWFLRGFEERLNLIIFLWLSSSFF